MSTTIHTGGLYVKDPDAKRFVTVDWDQEDGLPDGVEIQTSTWAITGPDASLTYDNPSVLAGNRQAMVRLLGGTRGARYTVTNHVVTDESPAQEDDGSFDVLIEQQ